MQLEAAGRCRRRWDEYEEEQAELCLPRSSILQSTYMYYSYTAFNEWVMQAQNMACERFCS